MKRASFFVFLWAINAYAVGSAEVVSLTFPTFLICLFSVSRIKSNYLTSTDMFWFVLFIFFVIAPIQSLHNNYFDQGSPVRYISFEDSELYTAALIVFLFCLVVSFISIASEFRIKYAPVRIETEFRYIIFGRSVPYLLVAVVVSFVLFVVFSGGVGNMLASRSEKDRSSIGILYMVALSSLLISVFMLLCTVKSCYRPRGSVRVFHFAAVLTSLVLLGLAQNPYNTPRYFFLAAWLPVVLIMVNGRLGAVKFYSSSVFGMLVVMPILSLTSRFGSDFDRAFSNVDISESFFRIPYVDVFEMLVYEVRYLAGVDPYYGMKTLGALLFFVPRAIWTTKPSLIALEMGGELVGLGSAGTDNLSLFFVGEFYADLGIFGVAIFSTIASFAYIKYFGNNVYIINGFRIREFIIIASIPIIIRGPIGANAPLIFLELLMFMIYFRIFSLKVKSERGSGSRREFIVSSPVRRSRYFR